MTHFFLQPVLIQALSELRVTEPITAWSFLPLLVPAAFVVYSMTAHYQRPTFPLFFDSLTFVAGLGLWIAMALHAPPLWVRVVMVAPVVLVLCVFFVGNKLCYRFFKDWVHHQMLLEWRMGKPILMDAGRSLQAWEWIGGIAIPIAAAGWAVLAGRRAPLVWLVPISLGLIVAGVIGHALTRSRFFNTDEHNPFLNLARGWFNELKGLNARRAAEVAPLVRPAPAVGYQHIEDGDYPLVQAPTQDATSPAPNFPATLMSNGSRPNVVLIVLESVRALECGAYGARVSMTPRLDALAREGLVLKNFYANGSQTVRGELALLCSFYDQFGGSPLYMRQPNIRIRSLPEILKEHGYSTHWISSYTASFHNKEEFLRNHGVDEVHDDRGLPPGLPKLNWGPPDEDLYRYAEGILDRQRQPFFAEIMTLTNHWPFQGPYPTSEQTPKVCDDKLYTNFTKGVYYTDYALGMFFDSIRDKPWFENTIFAITSDHGAWIYPDELGLNAIQKQEAYFRMPMVLYGPKWFRPGTYEGVTSQVDLAPTLLDILGIRSRHAFLGRSIYDTTAACDRSALMLHWHSWNVRRGNRYLYTLGRSFSDGHHNRCARPDDSSERYGTTFTCFEETGDLLRMGDASGVTPDSGAEMGRTIEWATGLLYLVEYLRLHNRVYDAPVVHPRNIPHA